MTTQQATSDEVSRADSVGHDRPYVPYRGALLTERAWLKPTPDIGVKGPALYYGVYEVQSWLRPPFDGPRFFGLADLDEIAPVLFAEWRFPTIARAVSDVVAASYVAERSAA